MDTTLVINPGSASKKFALYRGGVEVLEVVFEYQGEGFGRCVEVDRTRKHCDEVTRIEYRDALAEVIKIANEQGVIKSGADINRIGVRVVAPGTFFTTHRLIDFGYIKKLKALSEVAPLHIPPLLHELESVEKHLNDIPLYGISDSAFHSTLPIAAKWYGLPKKVTQEQDLYRFGFHGLSVASVVRKIAEETKANIPKRLIVCHIGSGVSVTAVKDGKSVDTTMGFGPTSGLMMGTRGGGVDPAALLHLMRQNNNPDELEEMISEEGGLKGITGVADLRIVLNRRKQGNKDAEIGFDMFIRAIRKAIGSMGTVLGGIDMIALTGTAVERNPLVRKHIAAHMEYLGLQFDEKANDRLGERPGVFSAKNSTITAQVVHTNEMTEIAQVARIL